MSELKTILKGAGFVFAGMIASKVLTYAWRLLLARQGPEVYGLFSLGIAVLSLGVVVSSAGLSAGVARFVAFYDGKKDVGRIKGMITTPLKLTFFISIVTAAAMFFLAGWMADDVFHKPQMRIILQIFAFALPAFALRNVLVYAITALQKVEYVILGRDVLDTFFKIVLAAIPILLGLGLFELSIGYAIATVLTFLVMLYFMEKVFPIIHSKVQSIRETRELLLFSAPLFLATIFDNSLRWADTLFLGVFTTAANVGIYNAALPTATLLSVVPTALLTLYGSVITHEYAKDNDASIQRLYQTVSRWILVCILPLFLFMLFFPSTIMYLLFGAQYAGDGRVLAVLAFGFFTFSLFLPGDNILSMLKRTKSMFVITAGGLAVNLALNLWLIPQYADLGAAVASAASLATMGFFSFWYVHRYTGHLPFGRRAVVVVLASAAVFFIGQQVALSLGLRLISQFGIFALLSVAYALIVWKLQLIQPQEVRFVKNALLKVAGRKPA